MPTEHLLFNDLLNLLHIHLSASDQVPIADRAKLDRLGLAKHEQFSVHLTEAGHTVVRSMYAVASAILDR